MHRRPDFSDRCKNFHLGCGPLIVPGYLNIDGRLAPDGLPHPVPDGVVLSRAVSEELVVQHDLRRGIPSRPEALSVIYHAHFLEHFTHRQGVALLADCFRCLAAGGAMRIAVPDLALWSRHYVEGNAAFFDWYRKTYLKDDRVLYATRGAVFMGMLHNWGHQMCYDAETLAGILVRIGFGQVEVRRWGDSSRVPQITSLEGSSPRRLESLVMECVKP